MHVSDEGAETPAGFNVFALNQTLSLRESVVTDSFVYIHTLSHIALVFVFSSRHLHLQACVSVSTVGNKTAKSVVAGCLC